MTRSLIWEVDLGRALPKEEPLAALMARLILLQADLMLECSGIGTEERIEPIDHSREYYRRMYFFRSSTGSLVAARDLLDQLMANPTFRKWLEDDPDKKAKFIACKGAFDKRRQLFERIRNQLGEHVAEDVGRAVERFKTGDHAYPEMNLDMGALTPKLAESILLCVLMPDTPIDQWDSEFLRIINEVRDATVEALRAMLIALHLYAQHYPLFPPRR